MPNKVEGSVRAINSSVVIASGASLTAAIDLDDARLASIQLPSAWTAANLTFQTSLDGVTYGDWYDSSGVEYTVTAAASRSIGLQLVDFIPYRYIKIRSGTTGTPVVQGAARNLILGLTA